ERAAGDLRHARGHPRLRHGPLGAGVAHSGLYAMIPLSRTDLPVLKPFRLGTASSACRILPPSLLPLNGSQGVVLVTALVVSAGSGEAMAAPAAPSILATIVKWTPLLAQGFALNIAMSFLAMAIGTAFGVAFGLGQISLLAPVRASAWSVTQFF